MAIYMVCPKSEVVHIHIWMAVPATHFQIWMTLLLPSLLLSFSTPHLLLFFEQVTMPLWEQY